MFQVLANVALLIALIVAVFYLVLLGSIHFGDYMENKRAVKREHKYDYLLNAAK